MTIERIVGTLFSGFMVRLYGAGLAIYVAVEASHFIKHAFALVGAGLTVGMNATYQVMGPSPVCENMR